MQNHAENKLLKFQENNKKYIKVKQSIMKEEKQKLEKTDGCVINYKQSRVHAYADDTHLNL